MRFTYLFILIILVFSIEGFAQLKKPQPSKTLPRSFRDLPEVAKDMILDQRTQFKLNNDDCEEVELEKPGGNLENIPHLDQGPLGTCYANTAAVMYTAFRKMYNEPRSNEVASPIDIAHIFSRNDATIDSGTLDDMKLLFKYPPCPFDSHRTKVGKKIQENASIPISIVQNELGAMYVENEIKPLSAQSDFYSDSAQIKKQYKQMLNDAYKCDKNSIYNKKNFKEIFDIIKTQNSIAVTKPYIDRFCKPSDRLKISKPINIFAENVPFKEMESTKFSYSRFKYINQIHNELNLGLAKALPVEVGICGYFLRLGPKSEIPVEYDENGRLKNSCESHSVLVSGRRKNKKTGQCEFKIRDSAGYCSYAKKFYDCNEATGEIWIDMNSFLRYMKGIVRIKH